MTGQTSAKWRLDSCEAITRASYPPLVLRGDLWAPIVRGDGVVRGAAIGVGIGKPTVFNISLLPLALSGHVGDDLQQAR